MIRENEELEKLDKIKSEVSINIMLGGGLYIWN